MEREPLGQFSNQFFSNILIQVALIVYCCSLVLISLLSNSFLTAALHALILFDFYLLISGLGYPVLVLYFINKTSSKTRSRNPTPAASSRRGTTRAERLIKTFW